MISAFVPLLLEAALRALLAAVAVWAGLRLLRVSNVVVQKAAWGLVLAAAIVMPFAPHWQGLPEWAALRLPSLPLPAMPWHKPQPAKVEAPSSAQPIPAVAAPELTVVEAPVVQQSATREPAAAPGTGDRYPAPAISMSEVTPAGPPAEDLAAATAPLAAQPAPLAASSATSHPVRSLSIAPVLWMVYLGVFAALLLRLLVGLATALRLWITAKPLSGVDDYDPATGVTIRFSSRVASPVNIGSGILLPADFVDWDAEKLRVVLAHERSHIRQGDFYLQLLAGLYASLFWFSPLGWWLKRKLCELGEAISDRAGLEEAASRSSYAQLLLEFAALPRPTLTGVAMARTSHLAQRIERLLNESSFRQAFAAGGRRALLALLLVPGSLLAATALVRVEAAAMPIVVALPGAQVAGQSTPEQVTTTAPVPTPTPQATPEAAPAPPPTPSPDPTPAAMPAPPAPPTGPGEPSPAPMAPLPPMPAMEGNPPMPPTPGEMAPMPRMRVDVHPNIRVHPDMIRIHPDNEMRMQINTEMRAEIDAAREEARAGRGFAFNYTMDGLPYALVGDPGTKTRIHGPNPDGPEEIEKARKIAHGHFLWFKKDGKSYVVDDPSIVSQVEAMNKAMDEIGDQMRALGKQMRDLGQQQRESGIKMRDVTVATPDLSKEMAELQATIEVLRSKQGGTITQKELGELQGKIGRIQGELGSLQGKIVVQQMNLNGGMGKFGEQQGKLGGQMGELGAKMGQQARENHTKIQGIIDDSVKNGKARPVE